MKEQRLVQIMPKTEENIGKTFRFQSGDRYTLQENGAFTSADLKPYRNKSERKKHLRERRLRRQDSLE